MSSYSTKTTNLNLFRCASAVPFLLLTGCVGGQIGGEIVTEGQEWWCVEHEPEAVDDGELTAPGFTAGAAMAAVAGTYESILAWGDARSELVVQVAPVSGSARWMKSDYLEGTVDEEHWLNECRDEMTFRAEVSVRSADDSFSASFDAEFVTKSGEVAMLTVPLDGDDVDDLVLVRGDDGDEPLTLHLVIARGVLSGSIGVVEEVSPGEEEATRSAPPVAPDGGHVVPGKGPVAEPPLPIEEQLRVLATFPEKSCDAGALIGLDDVLAQELIEQLPAVESAELTNENTQQSMTLRFEHTPSHACLISTDDRHREDVHLSLSSRVVSDDGAVDGTWEMSATANAVEKTVVLFGGYQGVPIPAEAFERTFGIQVEPYYEDDEFELQFYLEPRPIGPIADFAVWQWISCTQAQSEPPEGFPEELLEYLPIEPERVDSCEEWALGFIAQSLSLKSPTTP